MRVSIITPSFNQASFLEQTILSVLNQSFPGIEYIVIDGGSTDGSVDIIRKYQDRFAYWHSKKDRGHWDAVNQGFQKATGDVLHFLNSDDVLLDGAVERVMSEFGRNPAVGMVYGKGRLIDAEGNYLQDYSSGDFDLQRIFRTWENPVCQPTAFIRKQVFEKFGSPDEEWPFCADFEYWIRISSEVKFVYLPEYLACTRIHGATKTARMESIHGEELIRLCETLRSTPAFQNSGVTAEESLKAAYRVAAEHHIRAGNRRQAFKRHMEYSRYAFSGFERPYRILRFLGRLLFRT